MELNKRKSLLTPASPTVWGMIHGDISKQQDLIDKINDAVEGVEVDTSNLATKEEIQNTYIPQMENYVNEQVGETNIILDNMSNTLGNMDTNIYDITSQMRVMLEYTRMEEIDTITDDILS
jgi:hypothetical protein